MKKYKKYLIERKIEEINEDIENLESWKVSIEMERQKKEEEAERLYAILIKEEKK